jgi:hypothetical protein
MGEPFRIRKYGRLPTQPLDLIPSEIRNRRWKRPILGKVGNGPICPWPVRLVPVRLVPVLLRAFTPRHGGSFPTQSDLLKLVRDREMNWSASHFHVIRFILQDVI